MAYNQNRSAYPSNNYPNNTYNNNQTNRAPPPAYNERAGDHSPYPNNNNNNNEASSGYPATNSSLGGASILNQWQIRFAILLTILLAWSLFNLIPAAILSDIYDESDIFNAQLAGFCIIFAGCGLQFLLIHFNVNGCLSYNLQRTMNKVCGALIIIGGIVLLGANIAYIDESAENRSSCEDSDYVCCMCDEVALRCVLTALSVILIGIDLVSDFGNKQKLRVTLFSLVFIVAFMLVSIEWLANDLAGSSELSQSQVAGFLGVCIFGVLAIIAVYVGNAMMAKLVGIGFGASILLSLLRMTEFYDEVDAADIMYVGIGGFIVYDLVS